MRLRTIQGIEIYEQLQHKGAILVAELSCFHLFTVVPDADEVAGRGEGRPGDVEPAVAGEQLVGALIRLQELHEAEPLQPFRP